MVEVLKSGNRKYIFCMVGVEIERMESGEANAMSLSSLLDLVHSLE